MNREQLTAITERALALLQRLALGPADAIQQALRPTREDYEACFTPEAAKQAMEGYAKLWAAPPPSLARPIHAQVRLASALAQDIVSSRQFPGGYEKIAHLLLPDQIWLSFKFLSASGGDALAYDGLVARGDRFAWFPKPWRVLTVAPAN